MNTHNVKRNFNTKFEDIHKRVMQIASTENTYGVNADNYNTRDIIRRIGSTGNYSDYGLTTMGRLVGFPAPFVQTVSETNPLLANTIIADRVHTHFEAGKSPFYVREFEGDICGVVSDRYSFFDDKEVCDILAGSTLAEKPFAHATVTPERLHLRAVDADRPFRVSGDESDLFFAYFIDNSMVGQSSFKVQLGVYRLACTNGLIVGMKDYTLVKQIHRGNKDISTEFESAVAFLDEKRETIKEMICSLGVEEARIKEMSEEYKRTYLAKELNLSKKETEKVLTLYTETYGGRTKWDLVSAITEFARDTGNLDRREYLEKKALKVA